METERLNRLEEYIGSKNYSGYDPYDGLTSPLFRLPFLKNRKLRFYSQQLIKRFPFNIRSLLGIKPGVNPVTLGLCIQGYSNRIAAGSSGSDAYEKKIILLIEKLETFIPSGYHGACWGYDFDWEARYASIPAFQPTIVTTGIITNALFEYHQLTQNKKAADLILSAAEFVLNDLNIHKEADGTICFSYSPFDDQKVFNASMKGVRILSQAFFLSGDSRFKDYARKAAQYVINRQQKDGSWIYSENKAGGWIDNYHTGYILDALQSYINLCNDETMVHVLDKGMKFYSENFIHHDGRPVLYHKKQYPADCTAAAQCIITLLKNHRHDKAAAVAEWMLKNMQRSDGGFAYRKYRFYTNRTPFMRWSDAWMYAALTALYKETAR